MSVQRVYVGEPGGENLDVARETGGNAAFQPGDTVTVSKELADRLDASWATEGDAKKRGIASSGSEDEAPAQDDTQAASAEGGDSQ